MNPIAIVLVISLAANAGLGWAYLGQRDKAVVAVEKKDQATGAAQECSKGVQKLETRAAERKAAAAPKIEAARAEAAELDKRADQILATPPAVPGDDCRSAQARVDTWWQGRAKP